MFKFLFLLRVSAYNVGAMEKQEPLILNIDAEEPAALLELFKRPLFWLLAAGGLAWSFAHFGTNGQGVGYGLFAVVLLALSLIDLRHYILPDILIVPAIFVGVTLCFFVPWLHPVNTFAGMLFGFLMFWLLFWGFYKIRGYYGMGFGDVKLMAMLGTWAGGLNLPLIILLSSFVALPIFVIRFYLKGTSMSTPSPMAHFWR